LSTGRSNIASCQLLSVVGAVLMRPQEAAGTYLQGILGYEERPLVSTDYVDDARSGIVDAACTQVITRP
jgi:glyceraldehyde-3-phosphate dehydrogenase/erythrose-4-phosphate dehydrogenase